MSIFQRVAQIFIAPDHNPSPGRVESRDQTETEAESPEDFDRQVTNIIESLQRAAERLRTNTQAQQVLVGSIIMPGKSKSISDNDIANFALALKQYAGYEEERVRAIQYIQEGIINVTKHGKDTETIKALYKIYFDKEPENVAKGLAKIYEHLNASKDTLPKLELIDDEAISDVYFEKKRHILNLSNELRQFLEEIQHSFGSENVDEIQEGIKNVINKNRDRIKYFRQLSKIAQIVAEQNELTFGTTDHDVEKHVKRAEQKLQILELLGDALKKTQDKEQFSNADRLAILRTILLRWEDRSLSPEDIDTIITNAQQKVNPEPSDPQSIPSPDNEQTFDGPVVDIKQQFAELHNEFVTYRTQANYILDIFTATVEWQSSTEKMKTNQLKIDNLLQLADYSDSLHWTISQISTKAHDLLEIAAQNPNEAQRSVREIVYLEKDTKDLCNQLLLVTIAVSAKQEKEQVQIDKNELKQSLQRVLDGAKDTAQQLNDVPEIQLSVSKLQTSYEAANGLIDDQALLTEAFNRLQELKALLTTRKSDEYKVETGYSADFSSSSLTADELPDLPPLAKTEEELFRMISGSLTDYRRHLNDYLAVYKEPDEISTKTKTQIDLLQTEVNKLAGQLLQELTIMSDQDVSNSEESFRKLLDIYDGTRDKVQKNLAAEKISFVLNLRLGILNTDAMSLLDLAHENWQQEDLQSIDNFISTMESYISAVPNYQATVTGSNEDLTNALHTIEDLTKLTKSHTDQQLRAAKLLISSNQVEPNLGDHDAASNFIAQFSSWKDMLQNPSEALRPLAEEISEVIKQLEEINPIQDSELLDTSDNLSNQLVTLRESLQNISEQAAYIEALGVLDDKILSKLVVYKTLKKIAEKYKDLKTKKAKEKYRQIIQDLRNQLDSFITEDESPTISPDIQAVITELSNILTSRKRWPKPLTKLVNSHKKLLAEFASPTTEI